MREWKGAVDDISAVCDITYRHEAGSRAVCNFSFTYTGKVGERVPPLPQEVSFVGDEVKYSLSDIDTLFLNPQDKQIRVTTTLGGEDLLAVLRSQSIELSALFDGTEYRYTPPKDFISYRDVFLAEIAD
jgi:hypothetical protein